MDRGRGINEHPLERLANHRQWTFDHRCDLLNSLQMGRLSVRLILGPSLTCTLPPCLFASPLHLPLSHSSNSSFRVFERPSSYSFYSCTQFMLCYSDSFIPMRPTCAVRPTCTVRDRDEYFTIFSKFFRILWNERWSRMLRWNCALLRFPLRSEEDGGGVR